MLNTQYCVILYMPPDPQLLLGMSCTIWEGGDTMFKLLFLVTVMVDKISSSVFANSLRCGATA